MAFRDGLGERRLREDPGGDFAEILSIRRELSAVPSFEFALRDRVGQVASFQHVNFARVRGVERSAGPDHSLTVISDGVPGLRVSELLSRCADRHLPVPLDVALGLVRQLVSAIVAFHERGRDVADGALAPERLIISSSGRLVVSDYVLGSALEQLLFSRDRYWTELRVALPRVAGLPRCDHLADVTQIAVVAIALILGRPLRDEEYPGGIGNVLSSAVVVSARRDPGPLPAPLKGWLNRALQLDTRHSFPTAVDARIDFERVLGEIGCDPTLECVKNFLARHESPEVSPVALAAPVRDAGPPLPVSLSSQRLQREHVLNSSPSSDEVVSPAGAARLRSVALAAVGVMMLLLLTGGGLMAAWRKVVDDPTATPGAGKLLVTTVPAGLEVIVDGARRGNAPLALTLPAGRHRLELRGAGEPRVLPITIAAGAALSQYVELQRSPPFSPQGPVRPTTPAASAATSRSVANEASQSVGSLSGWFAVSGFFPVQIFENALLLGSSQDPLPVSVGTHDFELVNETLGYREMRSVEVASGKTTTLTLARPTGNVALNAQPWAEVWIDGEKVGETPIGNLSLPIGSHDVVFRHPELGERHEAVLATLKGLSRISVDMRTP